MDLNKLGFDTLALHAGFSGDACEGSTEVPIHQTSAYRFRSTPVSYTHLTLPTN